VETRCIWGSYKLMRMELSLFGGFDLPGLQERYCLVRPLSLMRFRNVQCSVEDELNISLFSIQKWKQSRWILVFPNKHW